MSMTYGQLYDLFLDRFSEYNGNINDFRPAWPEYTDLMDLIPNGIVVWFKTGVRAIYRYDLETDQFIKVQ